MELVILNLGLAVLNGGMAYFNYDNKNNKTSVFNAFACGFCVAVALAIFLNDL
jgi:hypothetical protein